MHNAGLSRYVNFGTVASVARLIHPILHFQQHRDIQTV